MRGDFDEEPDAENLDDPSCPDCGCDLFTEDHHGDCGYGNQDNDELESSEA